MAAKTWRVGEPGAAPTCAQARYLLMPAAELPPALASHGTLQLLHITHSSGTTTPCAAGMALLPGSYAVNVALQVALLPRIRAARAPWRELCYLLSCLHMVVANLVLSECMRQPFVGMQ